MSGDRREDDLLAVYLSGHGEVLDDGNEHVLLTADTDPEDLPYTALSTAELAQTMLRGTRLRRLLLILDTCYSGQGGNELAAGALDRITRQWRSTAGSGVLVVSSTQPYEQAETGVFPRLFEDAVENLATAGYGPDILSMSAVVQQMNRHPERPGHQQITLSLVGLTGEPPAFLINPRHNSELAEVDLAIQQAAEFDEQAQRRDVEFTTRLLVRAMGYHGDGVRNWWFCGRRDALRAIVSWLHRPASDTSSACGVVTAGPGSGKTAVLGLIAALTHPERRRTVPIDALGLDPQLVPDAESVDVAIYAQNLTDDAVLDAMAAAVGIQVGTPGELLQAVERQRRARPFTALIDALDEAHTPDTLCSRVLRPLIDHARGRVRLLLGTRPYLLDRLGINVSANDFRSIVINLDDPRYADPEALRAYTMRNLLEASPNSPYRGDLSGLREVGQAVAEAADTSFLVARITAGTLAATGSVVPDPSDREWRNTLPRLPADAMRKDLTTRLGVNAARAADLLRPLAFTEGQGLPWEDIWAPLASALSGCTYTDDDLLWLRRVAGSYVVEAIEFGRSAYRLYHQALAEYLREDSDVHAIHQTFADVLKDRVPYRIDGKRDWSRAHPYILSYLSAHAVAAGRIDELVTAGEYLVHAEPDTLLPALRYVTTEQGRLTAAIYRTDVVHYHRHAYQTRRQLLALDAARWGHMPLANEFIAGDTTAFPLTLAPRWATGGLTSPLLHMTFACWKSGVAIASIEGRTAVIFRGDDRIVQVRDPIDGTCARTLGHQNDRLFGIAVCDVKGDPTVVFSGDEDTVQTWSLRDGNRRHVMVGHTGTVNDIAVGRIDERYIAVSCSDDTTVRVWNLVDGTCVHTLAGHADYVHAVAVGEIKNRPIAVTGSSDATVRVWDVADGTCLHTLTGHKSSVFAVAIGEIDGCAIAVTGGYNDQVRVWNLSEGVFQHTIPVQVDVTAVTISQLDGRTVAVFGDANGTVSIWDISNRTCLHRLTGHDTEVSAVSIDLSTDVPIIVSSSEDSTVRTWTLDTDVTSSVVPTGHSDWVTSITPISVNGRSIAVSTSKDVRVWDLESGTCLHALDGDEGEIRAIAVGTWDEIFVAFSASLHSMRAWNVLSGECLHTFSSDEDEEYGVSHVALGNLEGRPVAIARSWAPRSTVKFWDLSNYNCLHSTTDDFCKILDQAQAIAVDPGTGRPIVLARNVHDGLLSVWDIFDETHLVTLPGSSGSLSSYSVAVGELRGRMVMASAGYAGVRVWDLMEGACLASLPSTGHASQLAIGEISGHQVVVIGHHSDEIRIWDLAENEAANPPFHLPCSISALAVSDDGVLIAFDRELTLLTPSNLGIQMR
jgi:WD40 repeat protein